MIATETPGARARRRAERPSRRHGEGFRPDIQGLRAVAVGLVAAEHAGVPGVGGGYVGVDVFFVISGFLITRWLLTRADRGRYVDLPAFYAARARRILPAATLTLLATAAASVLWLNYVRAIEVMHDVVWSAFFAANIHFSNLATDYFSREEPPSPLQHFWTLAVEEQFYLVWPVLLGLIVVVTTAVTRRRNGQPVPRPPVAAVLLVIIAASLWWSITQTSTDPTGAYFSTLTRAWELAVGGLVAVSAGVLRRTPTYVAIAAGWLGLIAIVVAGTRYSGGTAFPGYAAVLPVGGAALVVAAGIGGLHPRGHSWLLDRPGPRILGELSYSFYLWHWPVLVIAHERAGHDYPLAGDLALLAIALGLSALTYAVVENPLRHARFLTVRSARAVPLWVGSVGAVLIVSYAALGHLRGEEPPVYQLHAVRSTSNAPYVRAVRQSASPRMLQRPVPRSLAPSPANLLDDQYDLHGCDAGLGSRTTSRICRLGVASSSHTVVVFGDSHARMWMPAFLYWAQQRKLAIVPMIKEGCTPVSWVDPTTAEPDCRDWYRWALAEVGSMHPEAVVLATAYATWHQATDAATLQTAVDGFKAEMGELRSRSGKVVVIQDPPRTVEQPTDCLLKSGARLGDCAFHPSSAWATIDRGLHDGARGIASVLDTNQWLCAHRVCPMVIGHVVVYLNLGHVTSTYARWVERPFARKLDETTGL